MGSHASRLVIFIVPYFFFVSLYVFSIKLSYRWFSTVVDFFYVSHYVFQLRSLQAGFVFPCQSTPSCSGKVNKYHSLLQNLKQSGTESFFNWTLIRSLIRQSSPVPVRRSFFSFPVTGRNEKTRNRSNDQLGIFYHSSAIYIPFFHDALYEQCQSTMIKKSRLWTVTVLIH